MIRARNSSSPTESQAVASSLNFASKSSNVSAGLKNQATGLTMKRKNPHTFPAMVFVRSSLVDSEASIASAKTKKKPRSIDSSSVSRHGLNSRTTTRSSTVRSLRSRLSTVVFPSPQGPWMPTTTPAPSGKLDSMPAIRSANAARFKRSSCLLITGRSFATSAVALVVTSHSSATSLAMITEPREDFAGTDKTILPCAFRSNRSQHSTHTLICLMSDSAVITLPARQTALVSPGQGRGRNGRGLRG